MGVDQFSKRLLLWSYNLVLGLLKWDRGKESTYQCRRCKRHRFNPWVGKNHSVVSDSLRPHGLYSRCIHGILQARILEWVPYPFSSRPSQLRNRAGVSCITGRFFINWAIRMPIWECGLKGVASAPPGWTFVVKEHRFLLTALSLVPWYLPCSPKLGIHSFHLKFLDFLKHIDYELKHTCTPIHTHEGSQAKQTWPEGFWLGISPQMYICST